MASRPGLSVAGIGIMIGALGHSFRVVFEHKRVDVAVDG